MHALSGHSLAHSAPPRGLFSCDDSPSVFTKIYEDKINMSIWQRSFASSFASNIHTFLQANPRFQLSLTVPAAHTLDSLAGEFGDSTAGQLLCADVAQLVDMFCCLFDLERAGLRLQVINRAMCPRFHVDRVPCRLVSTYSGPTTEWLPHECVNRAKLGRGNDGLPDEQSGLYRSALDIQRLKPGHVALIKGESWEGNEGAGLVHRSPSVPAGQPRLLLTLDFSA